MGKGKSERKNPRKNDSECALSYLEGAGKFLVTKGTHLAGQ